MKEMSKPASKPKNPELVQFGEKLAKAIVEGLSKATLPKK